MISSRRTSATRSAVLLRSIRSAGDEPSCASIGAAPPSLEVGVVTSLRQGMRIRASFPPQSGGRAAPKPPPPGVRTVTT